MELKKGYTRTEAGVIPAEWEVHPLGEIAFLERGKFTARPRNQPKFFGGDFPFLQTGDVTNSNGDISTYTQTLNAEGLRVSKLFPRETLFFTIAANIADVGIVTFQTAATDSLVAISPNRRIDKRWLYHLLKTHKKYFEGLATKNAQLNLNLEKLRPYLIAVPPSSEQCAIGETLSDVDTLLGSLERIIAKKRNIKRAAMQQLLTRQTRLPDFHGKWEVRALSDLFIFSGGYSASREQLSTEGYCYLHYGDIHTSSKTIIDASADYQDIPKLNIALKRVASKCLLDDGDVVFVDASEDDAGASKHLVVVNKEKIPFIAGLHTIVAKSKTDELTHEYRRYCFQTSAIQQQFLFYAVGTKVTGISKTNIAKLQMPVPSVAEQTAIAEVLMDMDAELMALERRLEKTRALKQAMMQQLLTGKIRLVAEPANLTQFPAEQAAAPPAAKSHNWQINEAVVIAVLAQCFGSEKFPLGRKRYTKLSYLLHRHVERTAAGYLKKAAGPYNPATKYKGPEGIAQRNGYIRTHTNGQFVGFIAADSIAKAQAYFREWYGDAVLQWLEQFRFKTNDELELLATVDMAMEDLRRAGTTLTLDNVKQVIHDHPEWEAKLNRPIFSDVSIAAAMKTCAAIFTEG